MPNLTQAHCDDPGCVGCAPARSLNAATDVRSTYRCAGCGGDDVHLEMWVHLNTGEVLEDATDQAWCEHCQEHDIPLCLVDAAGQCDFHDQPFDTCREA